MWTALSRSLISFQREKVTPWLALRNTIGVVLPLLAAAALGSIPAGLAVATGALNVCYSDSQEPYPRRARRMLAACILVALGVTAGALFGRYHVLAVTLAAVWAFAAGILVAIGTSAADLGGISLVTLLVYSAVPQTPERAIYAGLLAFGGGVFQTALSVLSWPVTRYAPERRTLAALFDALAQSALTLPEIYQAPPASAESTQAQQAVGGGPYLALLSQAERMRIRLMMIGRLRVRLGHPEVLARYLEGAAALLQSIASLVRAPGAQTEAPRLLSELESLTEQLRIDPTLQSQIDALTGQLRAALDLASGAPESAQREERRPWRLRLESWSATLRANLTLGSSACRHAIRLAVCVALAAAIARAFALPRSYWLPMTVAIVLKPDFHATISRGVLRLIGTLLGIALATALFHTLPGTTWIEIALIAALMYTMRWVGSANYGIFVTAVTALVVLLIALNGVPPGPVMIARGLNTLGGGLIALIAYALWPTWERKLAPEVLAQMLDAYRDYFHAICQSYAATASAPDHALDPSRLAARLARSNAEGSVGRAVAEPVTPPETAAFLRSVMATSHRLIHAIMALEAGIAESEPVPARSPFLPFAADVETTLQRLANSLRGESVTRAELPDLRRDHYELLHAPVARTGRYALVNMETDRITNALNTLSEQILPA